jgi:DNA primase
MSISQDVESRINIVELVNKYVPLKKAGTNFKACCPFHNEKTPSFIVSPAKNLAYCFSCHKGGGPIKFLMEIEKIEFRDALRTLAKEAGVELKADF